MSYDEPTKGIREAPKQRRYIGTVGVATRYGRAVRTVQRWLAVPPEGFPIPRKHNGRWLWDVAELDAYDDAKMQPAPAKVA